jgi:vesicular inhibitory amino acid transporter
MMNPVSITWELWITSYPRIEAWCKYHLWRRSFITSLGRIILSAIVIAVATVFPGFDRVMVIYTRKYSFFILFTNFYH